MFTFEIIYQRNQDESYRKWKSFSISQEVWAPAKSHQANKGKWTEEEMKLNLKLRLNKIALMEADAGHKEELEEGNLKGKSIKEKLVRSSSQNNKSNTSHGGLISEILKERKKPKIQMMNKIVIQKESLENQWNNLMSFSEEY